MAGTIQEIAERAGVSRGTVDRALNHRGRVKPEVAEKIEHIAKEMGYLPKKKKRGTRIGVVTQLSTSSFMIQVNRGIADAAAVLEERGISLLLRECTSVDEAVQKAEIEELCEEGMDALALMPVDSDAIRQKLNELTEKKGMPVVTFNSDIVGTGRCCFIGLNNKKSGQTAAGLLGLMMQGRGQVLVITGFFSNSVSSRRVDGFVEEMKQSFPKVELVGVQSSFDQSAEVEKIILQSMEVYPNLGGIFVASGGQEGVKWAFEKLKLKKRPYVIVYDLTPKNETALLEGGVDFLIDQEGYKQGYQAPLLLADMLQKGEEPKQEFWYTEIKIKTKYNLDENQEF
ncbi:MAG: LacI family DNA-binding transcriptional regulator [bacterium]|nr:LacI family DNA-binding transcriptional regulator [bacterium]